MPKINYVKLLQSTSIIDVAQRLGMELRQETPTQAKALCPFHDDKTPSLLIDAKRDQGPQHYHCFACGAHGDAIDLVKERLNLGFKEAVDWLAPGSFSIAGRKQITSTGKAGLSHRDSKSGLELAYQLYKNSVNKLGVNHTEFDAWVSTRHLNADVLRQAGYVYAINNFLSSHLESLQDTSQRREQTGLLEDAYLVRKLFPGVKAGDHLPLVDHYSDFFIGPRIIFPLYDQRGLLLGLGGRSVDQLSGRTPKYQFTRGFPKASVLYRAEVAFKRIQKEAKKSKENLNLYLCEGFLDALRLESLGMLAVAVMGSSISKEQVQLLQTLGDRLKYLTVIVCFDRDEAGLRGAEDACLKLLRAHVECKFLWPTEEQLAHEGIDLSGAKDPNDYLENLSKESATQLIAASSHPPELAVLANAFGISAEDTLNNDVWEAAPRSHRYRALSKATSSLKKIAPDCIDGLKQYSPLSEESKAPAVSALIKWSSFLGELTQNEHPSLSEVYLNNNQARLNHARILAYMGSKRGELPCDEPRWERLDIAATAFNALLVDRLRSMDTAPIGSYDAVWVPRAFGGDEPRLKMMPRAEDLIIQQYLLNEILTERWDLSAVAETFSRNIPAVRYYREEYRTVTTGFDIKGDEKWGELSSSQTLSFAYQIDMDVLEGRQPATDQGMFRPYFECWCDFMKSLSKQATDIGYVYSIRLDVKRYYDRLRRYIVRDRLLSRLEAAIGSVTGETPGFANLLRFEPGTPSASSKASTVLDRIDEQLFGVCYRRPDTGFENNTEDLIGIPQGPVLSAWIGSTALFPVDEEAYRFMERLNTPDCKRVGYARYVDDIVLLADSPSTLMEMRDAIDRCARKLELTLLAKADEIPAMSAADFSAYINEGRAFAVSGPAWEPPLVGDGESGWGFLSVAPTTNRQSALHLLRNVELYKAKPAKIYQTVRTAFQAPDLRASELSKAALWIWYAIAQEATESKEPTVVWTQFMQAWNDCLQGASWQLQPDKYAWELPQLFALEGLEHLLDTEARDAPELSAEENDKRRKRIMWLAEFALTHKSINIRSENSSPLIYQTEARSRLIVWKAARHIAEPKNTVANTRLESERSKLFKEWRPFEWLHKAITLLADAQDLTKDPLLPFVEPTRHYMAREANPGVAHFILKALLPEEEINPGDSSRPTDSAIARIALQTLVSVIPRNQLSTRLSQRPSLIFSDVEEETRCRLMLPPLPGLPTSRLFGCFGENSDKGGLILVDSIEAIEFEKTSESSMPCFYGHDGNQAHRLAPVWLNVDNTNLSFVRLKVDLADNDVFNLLDKPRALEPDVSAGDLKKAATLFRALAHIVTTYADENDDRELVPAWPFIATDASDQIYHLICDSVSQGELGSIAFIRDGGRALRTTEIPIFEAHLWRVGIAISDYLGLHDDVTKFSSTNVDVTLDATELANPARYVLRAQLRKLRGAYANSNMAKRTSKTSDLPASVERALTLLESFPDKADDPLGPVFHVLTVEAESAGMCLSIRERWEGKEIYAFLTALSEKVLSRLPLSISEVLASSYENDKGIRRDFAGLLCFAKRLFSANSPKLEAETIAWKALRAGVVCAGISAALDGLLSSMRSHGAFERYTNFDFPSNWEVPAGDSSLEEPDGAESVDSEAEKRFTTRTPLVAQLRRLVQHLGHRLQGEGLTDQLSEQLIESLKVLTKTALEIEHLNDADSLLEWPFEMLNDRSLELLNLELLESLVELTKQIDEELDFEVVSVIESSFGYNAKSRRFSDSKGGVCEVTPWMISQFPRNSEHIEEINNDGQFLRVWSEVFDRKTNKLLSVSALGEPFASIAIEKKSKLNALASKDRTEPQEIQSEPALIDPTNDTVPTNTDEEIAPDGDIALSAHIKDESSGLKPTEISQAEKSKPASSTPAREPEDDTTRTSNEFLKRQRDAWEKRASQKINGHVRIALLQADMGLTYNHPFVEASPSNWPFSGENKSFVSKESKHHSIYGPLLSAAAQPDSAHFWTGHPNECEDLPSWAEHRRRRILRRVINSCVAFGVDLLVLPEYSVRIETIEWLKKELANKELAVLAGTYMEFRQQPDAKMLSAPLTLLWPVPKGLSCLLEAEVSKKKLSNKDKADSITRGLVLEFSRYKKYRSIALEELIRPFPDPLAPLFKLDELPLKLKQELKLKLNLKPAEDFELSPKVLIKLLAETRLPLKHCLELICSEIFLVTSPANYLHMSDDLKKIRGKFGGGDTREEVFEDVKVLASQLHNTGNGIHARRSILVVPAATSRSADYWIAGQASFLSAGTTTVFCNCIGGKVLVGGSCFVGKGSWKTDDGIPGYLPNITPYHGWSKGIYYNDKEDALGKNDQAVVIADIDPYNMMEGKPRAQTMPLPLQLVAYLPISISTSPIGASTEENLLRGLPFSEADAPVVEKNKKPDSFWDAVRNVEKEQSQENLKKLWSEFPDEKSLESRVQAYVNNGDMQPVAPVGTAGIFSTPAYYDWIKVSLTLTDQEELPLISVPPWRKQKP